jgi:hypothetical protein
MQLSFGELLKSRVLEYFSANFGPLQPGHYMMNVDNCLSLSVLTLFPDVLIFAKMNWLQSSSPLRYYPVIGGLFCIAVQYHIDLLITLAPGVSCL